MKTKISLMLLGLGLVSGAAYAGTVDTTPMPVSNDINLTAPDQSGMWSFGATALLMQPIGGNFDYADSVSNTVANGNNSGTTAQNLVDQNYNWWFGADVSYAFPGNGRDVMLAYEGMHSTNSGSVDSDDQTRLASPFKYTASTGNLTGYNANGHTFTQASGEVETNYDAADLLFGQKIDVGSRVRLHPFAGLRYAYINQKDTATYTGGSVSVGGGVVKAPTNYNVNESGEVNSTFSGIGPRFGTDAQVNLGQGWSLRGRLGLSALIGSRSADNSYVDSYYLASTGDLASTDSQSADTSSQTRVVPEIDGRLGLNYTYDFASNMAMGVELGWQAENYFNSVVNVTGGNSDFALQGPYARLQFDVA